jgi:catechol 2,3-dioxygenase-like lactoylglutathione lyase family enzyme
VALRVSDIARSTDWYRRTLGYDVVRDGHSPTPDRTRNTFGLVGGLLLELLQADGPGEAPGQSHYGIVGLSLTVADLAAAVAALKAAGEGVTSMIEAGPWKVAFLRDPDGSVIELVQQPNGAPDIAALAEDLRSGALG